VVLILASSCFWSVFSFLSKIPGLVTCLTLSLLTFSVLDLDEKKEKERIKE